ncbi:MAG: hypothetical protein AAFX06_24840, partial [Planctomycetota bacterium]
MMRAVRIAFWVACVLLILGLTTRLLWKAARSETGLEVLSLQWADATVGLVTGKRIPIPAREPPAQAQYWLDEIEDVIGRNEGDSTVSVGAALVLDSPGKDYLSKYVSSVEVLPGIGASPQLDWDRAQIAENRFEKSCRERCLELAKQATEQDPDNVDWWRLRALLLWCYPVFSSDDGPRAENWDEVLAEASRHDPGNALYDYLAAHFDWASSLEIDFGIIDVGLVVNDRERFERGVRRFEQGQRKRFLVIGDAGFRAVERFLHQSSAPLTEHEKVANSRLIPIRRSLLLRNLWRWQGMRAEEAESEGDVQRALALHRENHRLIKQFLAAGGAVRYDNVVLATHVGTTSK